MQVILSIINLVDQVITLERNELWTIKLPQDIKLDDINLEEIKFKSEYAKSQNGSVYIFCHDKGEKSIKIWVYLGDKVNKISKNDPSRIDDLVIGISFEVFEIIYQIGTGPLRTVDFKVLNLVITCKKKENNVILAAHIFHPDSPFDEKKSKFEVNRFTLKKGTEPEKKIDQKELNPFLKVTEDKNDPNLTVKIDEQVIRTDKNLTFWAILIFCVVFLLIFGLMMRFVLFVSKELERRMLNK